MRKLLGRLLAWLCGQRTPRVQGKPGQGGSGRFKPLQGGSGTAPPRCKLPEAPEDERGQWLAPVLEGDVIIPRTIMGFPVVVEPFLSPEQLRACRAEWDQLHQGPAEGHPMKAYREGAD